ncbi:hypothetical protein, partial [Microbispora sp. NPDC049125]|uniref:hypothetical protein n=1 Tax=Microbispora sp. NPDC049125 TaxID=3154929 RepID=UPI0034658250
RPHRRHPPHRRRLRQNGRRLVHRTPIRPRQHQPQSVTESHTDADPHADPHTNADADPHTDSYADPDALAVR